MGLATLQYGFASFSGGSYLFQCICLFTKDTFNFQILLNSNRKANILFINIECKIWNSRIDRTPSDWHIKGKYSSMQDSVNERQELCLFHNKTHFDARTRTHLVAGFTPMPNTTKTRCMYFRLSLWPLPLTDFKFFI